MSLFDRLTKRALSLMGLDFDFSLDQIEEPFHRICGPLGDGAALALGARPRREQLEQLRDAGITHVVSCLPEGERESVGFLGDDFETLFVALRDGVHEDVAGRFPAFFDFVQGAGGGATVLVHCEVGVSRSATFAIAHVMKSRQLRFYEAYHEVRRRRVQVLPNVGFASQLQRFEHALFPQPRAEGHASLTRYLHEVCKVPVDVDVLEDMLGRHDYDALRTIRAIFGDEVPRVVQGVRLLGPLGGAPARRPPETDG